MRILRFSQAAVLAALFGCATGAVAFEATKAEVAAFLIADKNQDRVLNRQEFKTFVQQMAKAGNKTSKTVRAFGVYTYAFKVTDKNRDGVVTPQELRTADEEYQAANK